MDMMADANNQRSLAKASENVKKSPSWSSSASATLLALGAIMLQPATAAKTSTAEHGSTDGDGGTSSVWTRLVEALGWDELPIWAMDPTDPSWVAEVQATLLGDASDWDPNCRCVCGPSCRAAKDMLPGTSSSDTAGDSMYMGAIIKSAAVLVVAVIAALVMYKFGFQRWRTTPAVVQPSVNPTRRRRVVEGSNGRVGETRTSGMPTSQDSTGGFRGSMMDSLDGIGDS